jgi:sugar/nucleoside kinase (ribokinase family)
VLAALASHKIDVSGLVRKPETQTSATMLPIRGNGERPALHVPGATRLFEYDDIDLARLQGCDAVLLGGPDALGGLSASELAAIVTAAKAAGALVAIDVLHPGNTKAFERLSPAIAGADWFWPNSDQLLALTGRADVGVAISDVLALGVGGVAVTLGADGCLIAPGNGDVLHIPAIKTTVVDTTGCGDSFNAGMLTGLLLGCDPVDSAWLGVACGALVASGLGSDAGIVSLEQVIDCLAAANTDVAEQVSTCRARNEEDGGT